MFLFLFYSIWFCSYSTVFVSVPILQYLFLFLFYSICFCSYSTVFGSVPILQYLFLFLFYSICFCSYSTVFVSVPILQYLFLFLFYSICLCYFQALTDKYASQRKVQLSLESHILQLHSDIEKLKKPAAIRNREKQLAEENTASGKCMLIYLILMLVVADLDKTKWYINPLKWLKPWHKGTHLRVLSESYVMNTNMTGFRCMCMLVYLTLALRVADLANTKWCEKRKKMTESLAQGYSSESTQWELCNEYQHDRV